MSRLIARFLDDSPVFLYVPTESVREVAKAEGALSFDVPDVELSHVGELCSYDAFLKKYKLENPALQRLRNDCAGCGHGEARPHTTIGRSIRHFAWLVRHVSGQPRNASA
jgi:hypothetical protein